MGDWLVHMDILFWIWRKLHASHLCARSEKEIPQHFAYICTAQLKTVISLATGRLRKTFKSCTSSIRLLGEQERLAVRVCIAAFHILPLGVNCTISDSYYCCMCIWGAVPLRNYDYYTGNVPAILIRFQKKQNPSTSLTPPTSLASSKQANRVCNTHHHR